jgi:hypothetical protein
VLELGPMMHLEIILMPFPLIFRNPVYKSIMVSALMAMTQITKCYEIISCPKRDITMTHDLLSYPINAV